MQAAWTTASLLFFAAFAGCSNDDKKPELVVDVKSFLSSCVPYCKQELACHPQLSRFVSDCTTYCQGQADTLFPEGGTTKVPCDVSKVESKLKQCSSSACGDFDACAKGVASLCAPLQAPKTDGGGVDSGAGGSSGTGAGGSTGTMDTSTDSGVAGRANGEMDGGGAKTGTAGASTSGGGAPATGGTDGAGGTFAVQCSLPPQPVGQQGTCYLNMTQSPVNCRFTATCNAMILPGMLFCPQAMCAGGGRGGSSGAGGATATGGTTANGGASQNCTLLDGCCQSITNQAAQQQCQSTVSSGNDAQCRTAITTGGLCGCSALQTCCATLGAAQQQQCDQVVAQGVPNTCTSALGSMCGCSYLTTCCQSLTDNTQRQQCLAAAQQNNANVCAQNAPLYCAQ